MSEAERALVGVESIAAFVETWWRDERGLRGVRVSGRTIRRWLKLPEARRLPAHRLSHPGAPWIGRPSEIAAWLERYYQHTACPSEMSALAPIAPIGR